LPGYEGRALCAALSLMERVLEIIPSPWGPAGPKGEGACALKRYGAQACLAGAVEGDEDGF